MESSFVWRSSLGFLDQKLIISLMQSIAVFSLPLDDQHRACSIVPETAAPIEPITEIIQKVAHAPGNAPLDIRQRDGVSAGNRLAPLDLVPRLPIIDLRERAPVV
jgi:hypothetical protein